MEIKNYDWKQIVFEIRDLIAEKFGYREKYNISNVLALKTKFDCGFSLIKFKCNMDVNYATLDTIVGTIEVPVKFEKYNDVLFSTSILVLSYNKPMDYDVSNIMIDRWRRVLEKTYEDVKKLEKIQKIYMDNGINIRFIISLIHEIGHAFEDVSIDSYSFNDKLKSMRLNFNERNLLYHRRRDETLADVVSINSLYLYSEEILNIILKNKKDTITYDLNSMFAYILECNKTMFDEIKSENNINK